MIKDKMTNNQIIIYNNGEIEIDVSITNKTIWLKTEDIAILFNVQRPAIVKHIKNIYKTKELDKTSTCSILEQVAKDGKRRKVKYYNLDMIISVGYRVNSIKATRFRQWATKTLKNYISEGYVINSEKITNQRFKELENEVRVIKQKIDYLERNNMLEPKQGIFYDGQIFDAYKFVSGLVKKAEKSIVLIDNYIDESVLVLFSKRKKSVKAVIYTKSISKQLLLDLEKFNSQYGLIEIKEFDKSHDRFIIIDNKEVYHIGASLKDLGKKWFAFSKIDKGSIEMLRRIG